MATPASSGFDYWVRGRPLATRGLDTGGLDYWLAGRPYGIAGPTQSPAGDFDYWHGGRPLASRALGTRDFDFFFGGRPAPALIRGVGAQAPGITTLISQVTGQQMALGIVWQTVIGQSVALGQVTSLVTGFHGAQAPADAAPILPSGDFDYFLGHQPQVTRALDTGRFNHWLGQRLIPLIVRTPPGFTSVTSSVTGNQMALGRVLSQVSGFAGARQVEPIIPTGGFDYWLRGRPLATRARNSRSFDYWLRNQPFVLASSAVVIVSGLENLDEEQERAGGRVITITSEGDTWIPI